jgi:hypothetical protein
MGICSRAGSSYLMIIVQAVNFRYQAMTLKTPVRGIGNVSPTEVA